MLRSSRTFLSGALRRTVVVSQSWALRRQRPWMCIKSDCHSVNASAAQECEVCMEPKPNLLGWACMSCGTRNHKGVANCRNCGGSATQAKGYWCCASCNHNNPIDEIEDSSKCLQCGYDMAPMLVSEAERLRRAEEQSESFVTESGGGGFSDAAAGGWGSSEQQDASSWDAPTSGGFDGFGEGIPSAPKAGGSSGEFDSGLGERPPATRETSANPSAKAIPKPALITKSKAFHQQQPQQPPTRSKLGRDSLGGPPGFDWMCRQCGDVNQGSTEGCLSCGELIQPRDWTCESCGAKNHRSRGKCFDCGSPIQVAWTCQTCRSQTSIYETECRTCQSPRPQVREIAREEMGPLGIGTRGKAYATAQVKAGKSRGGEWICVNCRTKNFAFRDTCFGCDQPRAQSSPQKHEWDESSARAVGENNWNCRYCRAVNFRTRTECWQCGRPSRASSVVPGAMDPTFEKEGFQAGAPSVAPGTVNVWSKREVDDWTCTKCFTKNFASKKECHRCGAPKVSATRSARPRNQTPVKI